MRWRCMAMEKRLLVAAGPAYRFQKRRKSTVQRISAVSYTHLSFAQDLTVKGKVTDTTGETVIGANVTVRGTTNGIITDIDGNYTLSGVKPSSVLVFSFIGYKTQEIPCSGRQEINVVLSEDAQALDEVVVVGYGSLSKKELSSSIVQVDSCLLYTSRCV